MNRTKFMLAAVLSAAYAAHAQPAPPAADYTVGEVRKIDKANRKVTLKHGEIHPLNMPAMTMVFAARDPALLEHVKPGDQVRFRATNENGVLYVIDLKPAR